MYIYICIKKLNCLKENIRHERSQSCTKVKKKKVDESKEEEPRVVKKKEERREKKEERREKKEERRGNVASNEGIYEASYIKNNINCTNIIIVLFLVYIIINRYSNFVNVIVIRPRITKDLP